jgi:hypothetical protein
VLAPEFEDTQGGTLHFRYLLAENGGFLRVAPSLEEHARQVSETVQSPDIGRAACAQFVERFVRPYGRDAAATPRLVDALEQMASRRRARATVAPMLYPLQMLLHRAGRIAVNRAHRRAQAKKRTRHRSADETVVHRRDTRADVPTTKAG